MTNLALDVASRESKYTIYIIRLIVTGDAALCVTNFRYYFISEFHIVVELLLFLSDFTCSRGMVGGVR